MSGAVQQSRAIGYTNHVVVKFVHVLARQKKSNYDACSEYQMDLLHSLTYKFETRDGARSARWGSGVKSSPGLIN